jgi:hypothetical protein
MARKNTLIIISVTVLLVGALLTYLFEIDFNISGHFEGLYLVHEKGTGNYEVTDHLFVGEGQYLVYGTTFRSDWFRSAVELLSPHNEKKVHLHVEWTAPF